MKLNKMNRRHFLQGVGGATLGLPFLPSLMSKSMAAELLINAPKNFVHMATMHGAIRTDDFYPTRDLGNQVQIYSANELEGPDHNIHHDQLNLLTSTTTTEFNPNGEEQISSVLGSFLTPHLDKVNIIRGLDLLIGNIHHGAYLGNFHENSGLEDKNGSLTLPAMPGIDYLMEQSANFYGLNDPVTQKLMYVNAHVLHTSHVPNGSNVVARSVSDDQSARRLFDSVFGANFSSGEADPETNRKTGLINLVLQDYNRLTNGEFGDAKLISTEDKLRLEQYIDEFDELERKISMQAGGGGCTASRPTNSTTIRWEDSNLPRVERIWEDYLDVIAAAIRCGKSRIAVMAVDFFGGYTGDWHADIAHNHFSSGPARELTLAGRRVAERLFTGMIERLDVNMGLGTDDTYLDHSLVVWNQEASELQHSCDSLPTVTAGSAGGFFNTGHYIDYRNRDNLGINRWHSYKRPGLPYNRWLYTMLRSMNIEQPEFARQGMYGYGDPYLSTLAFHSENSNHVAFPQRLFDDCDELLPVIT